MLSGTGYPSDTLPPWNIYVGNVSGANQPLHANYENFNLSHQINIQGEERRWEEEFAKV